MMSDRIDNGKDLTSLNISGEDNNTDSSWGDQYGAVVCENCDWRFIHTNDVRPERCPYCSQEVLTSLGQDEISNLFVDRPELYLPFGITQNAVSNAFQHFTKGIRFAPKDLTLQNLRNRLNRVFIPKWLVDIEVSANWEAEVGFDYHVVSHRERYDQNSRNWKTQEVNETRIRWETRVGRLNRTYHNIQAPGLEEDAALVQRLGMFDTQDTSRYDSSIISNAYIGYPNRSKEDAWPAVLPSIRSAASQECMRAASADHIHQFRWDPTFENHNWTLLLLPLLTTYYLDDENVTQTVFLHGQTGRVSGDRKASMKRAQMVALLIFLVASMIFLLSLVVSVAAFLVPGLIILGGIGLLLSILVGICPLIPIILVWQFNRKESQSH